MPASFFVAMGPDHSGRAIRRLFTHKGFLHKMLRTGAPRLYGLKTMLYGTLLPGPAIAASDPDLLRSIPAAGHELGIHGYDHVRWQDRLPGMSDAAVTAELCRAQKVFLEIMGYRAISFAAPGWQCTPRGPGCPGGRTVLLPQQYPGLCAVFPQGRGPGLAGAGNSHHPPNHG